MKIMLRRTLALFLCAVLCAGMFPTVALAEEEVLAEVAEEPRSSLVSVGEPETPIPQYIQFAIDHVSLDFYGDWGPNEVHVYPSDCDQTVVWSSDNPSVALVDPYTGIVHAVGSGVANITAKVPNTEVSASFVVEVSIPTPTLSIDPTYLTLAVGQTAQIMARYEGGNCTSSCAWMSTNPAVASVSGGLVTAVGVGTATITAAMTDGTAISNVCIVTVTASAFTHTITSGDHGVFDGTNPLIFITNDLHNNFKGVSVDGYALTSGNQYWEQPSPAGYIAVMLNPDFLAQLSGEIEHTIQIVSTNGAAIGYFRTVQAAPTLVITKNLPMSLNVKANEQVTLSVEAVGGNGTLSFQWYSSRGPLGCTDSSITFTAASSDTIWCVVTSGEYAVVSNTCQLNVISDAGAEISVENASALCGDEITLPVYIAQNPGITGFSFTIEYDNSLLTLTSVEAGAVLNGAVSTYGNTVNWYDPDGIDVFGTGELLKLHFTVNDRAPEGITAVSVALKDGKASNLTNAALHPVSVEFIPGTLTIFNGVLGDVTGDNDVTISDVVKLNQAVLGKVRLNDKETRLGDVTFDSYITIADVVKVNQFVLGRIKSF